MSPLFLVGCGLLVAALLLGATGAPAAVWVLLGAAGAALFWRGAVTTPKRGIRSRSAAASRAKSARSGGRPGARAPRSGRRPGSGRRPR